jgi:hypothetical protein
LPEIDYEAVLSKETDFYETSKKMKEKHNPNVSDSARQIFAEMERKYPIRWDNKDIVLYEIGVTIKPPYQPDNCVGDATAVERVKKMVSLLINAPDPDLTNFTRFLIRSGNNSWSRFLRKLREERELPQSDKSKALHL